MTRTTSKSVQFRNPFVLTGLAGEQPAGVYAVETNEVRRRTVVPSLSRIETRVIVPVREMAASGHLASQTHRKKYHRAIGAAAMP